MTYVLDFRGANMGGPVLPAQLVEGRLNALQMAGDVTFLLHGFNVDRAEGKAGLKRFAEHLSMVPHHALVATLWPDFDSLHRGGRLRIHPAPQFFNL